MLDFITDRIAIGNSHDATDRERLGAHNITGVLNVALDLDLILDSGAPPTTVFPVEYQKAGLWDGDGNPPGALVAAVLTLDAMLQRHQRVLVHCHAGISRSPVVVATYLAQRHRIPFEAALRRVVSQRQIAAPHGELCRLAESLPDLDGLLTAGEVP